MQTSHAFGRVQDILAFFRNPYDSSATYRATLDQLTGAAKTITDAGDLPEPDQLVHVSTLALHDLSVSTPSGMLLLKGLDLEIGPRPPLLKIGSASCRESVC